MRRVRQLSPLICLLLVVLVGAMTAGSKDEEGAALYTVRIEQVDSFEITPLCKNNCTRATYSVVIDGVPRHLESTRRYDVGQSAEVCLRSSDSRFVSDLGCPSSLRHPERWYGALAVGFVATATLYRAAKRDGLYDGPAVATDLLSWGPPLVSYAVGLVAVGLGIALQLATIWVRPVEGTIVAAEVLGARSGVVLDVDTADGLEEVTVDLGWFLEHNPTDTVMTVEGRNSDADVEPTYRPEPLTIYRPRIGGPRIWSGRTAGVIVLATGCLGFLLHWAFRTMARHRLVDDSSDIEVPAAP